MFFFSSRRRHTRSLRDWSSDVCSSDLGKFGPTLPANWNVVGAADFNGDNKPDYALFNAATHQTGVWYLNNNVFVGGAFGPSLPANWSLIEIGRASCRERV